MFLTTEDLPPEIIELLVLLIVGHEDEYKRTILFYTINSVVQYRFPQELIPASRDIYDPCVYKDEIGNCYDALGMMLNYEQARLRMLSCTKWLLENGADPNHMDEIGTTPLLTAISTMHDPYECAEMCEILLRAGANPNLHGRHTLSPLITAVLTNNLLVVRLLVEYGANVNAEYRTPEFASLWVKYGETALGLAARMGQREIAYYLTNTRKHKLNTLIRTLSQPGLNEVIKQDILDVFECFPAPPPT